MLQSLHLKNVGPAAEMKMQLSQRLNVITGDNGLGKSFLLDIAWWAVTGTWARQMIVPSPSSSVSELGFQWADKLAVNNYTSQFDRRTQAWSPHYWRSGPPGLVLYAQVDGGFSVFDLQRILKTDVSNRMGSYLFSAQEVWDGNDYCEGLIRDWASWQREGSSGFSELLRALKILSPSPDEPIEAGELRKVFVEDPKRYPTLKMTYGEEVPVIHASAGMRRVLALAYLLVWTWQEHLEACKLLGEEPTSEITFLIDEVEAHLHPRWQRQILPAILEVIDAITGTHKVRVQLIATTHSALVLASLESLFDPSNDSWFDLDLGPGTKSVTLQKKDFVRYGDVSNWLTSEAFDLKEARSLQAEQAITAALSVLKEPKPTKEEIQKVDDLLRNSLSDIDRFWVRWSGFRDRVSAGHK